MRFLSVLIAMLLGVVLSVQGLSALAQSALAQDTKPGKPASPKDPPKAGESPFSDEPLLLRDAERPTAEDWQLLSRLWSGNANAMAPPAQQMLPKMAKYLAYRLTWTEIQEGRDAVSISQAVSGTTSPNRDGILKALPIIPSQAPADEVAKQQFQQKIVYLQEYVKALLPPLREVLKNRLIARVNAAMVLARLVEFGQEDAAEELVKVIENPIEHDAVRHWAFQGLRRLYALPKADARRAERCALLLCRQLDERCKTPAERLALLSPPEVDGLRYVRRELVRGLGAVGRPLVVDFVPQKGVAKPAQREGPAAELLVRVMNNDKVSPEASWPERVEAAVALCQLKHKTSPSYQPEFVVSELGRFVAEMAAEASNNKDAQRWKYFAAELRRAVEELSKDLAAHPSAATYLKQMGLMGIRVLDYVYTLQGVPENAQLNQWLNQNKPKAASVYAALPAPG